MKDPWKILADIKNWGLSSSLVAFRDPFDSLLTIFESAAILKDRFGCSYFKMRSGWLSPDCGADR